MANADYYYLDDAQKPIGPVEFSQIEKEALARQKLGKDTYFCKTGSSEWSLFSKQQRPAQTTASARQTPPTATRPNAPAAAVRPTAPVTQATVTSQPAAAAPPTATAQPAAVTSPAQTAQHASPSPSPAAVTRYKRPLAALLFYILGGIQAVFAVIAIIGAIVLVATGASANAGATGAVVAGGVIAPAIGFAVMLLFSAVVYVAIGQVFDLIGKIEFNTRSR